MNKSNNIFKNKFFISLFSISSILLIIIGILTLNQEFSGADVLTLDEMFITLSFLLIIWFVVSFIISYIKKLFIINKMKTNKLNNISNRFNYNKKHTDEKDLNDKYDGENYRVLYSCNSSIDIDEYKKMIHYFPYKVYYLYIISGLLISFILCLIGGIISQNFLKACVFFVIMFLSYLFVFRIKLEYFEGKRYKKKLDEMKIDKIIISTKFYEDYFTREYGGTIIKCKYSDISKIIETDTNFYLEYPKGNSIIILQKNRCDLELINFIRDKFDHLEK